MLLRPSVAREAEIDMKLDFRFLSSLFYVLLERNKVSVVLAVRHCKPNSSLMAIFMQGWLPSGNIFRGNIEYTALQCIALYATNKTAKNYHFHFKFWKNGCGHLDCPWA
jgi:hypothetical protein